MPLPKFLNTDPDAPPGDFEDHLSYWLRIVASHASNTLGERLKSRDFTVNDWIVLRTLLDAPSLPQHVLNRLVGMNRVATWKVVRRLQERGLVQRELKRGRARQHGLSLTAAGEALVPQLAALADDNELDLFLHLPPGVHEALVDTLRALAHRHNFGFRHIPRRRKNPPAIGL